MAQDRGQEVKSKVEGLGLKLKLHLEQENDEADGSSEPGETKAALEEMGAKLQEALTSFGNAAKDPAIRADMKDLGVLLRDAMTETFTAVGAEVEGVLKKTKGEKAAEEAAEAADEAVADVAEVEATEEAPDATEGDGKATE